ncbi:MAG: acyloxyacyl hydrolase [Muribaculaceae bacterium]|nr:acyloxyacyl hydrolase [Muribaculaceae bacterium]
MKHIFSILLFSLLSFSGSTAHADDSIPSGFSRPLTWRVGADITPAYVLGTDNWLKGDNSDNQPVRSSLSINFRTDFSFSPDSREGILYPGLYQGIGIGPNFFFKAYNLLGTPASIFAYQGFPFKHFSPRLSLGYEWQFGIGAGWNDGGGDSPFSQSVISTVVTAHMGVRLKLKYELTKNFNLTLALAGTHFSNGNTSWRNSGLNSAGISIGAEYCFEPDISKESEISAAEKSRLKEEADRKKWVYDIMAFGAWRKRTLLTPYSEPTEDGGYIDTELDNLLPGKYAVAGLQFAPMLKLNRWVAVGPALDLKWDKSAGKRPYWIEDTYEQDIKFRHVPFGKQVSAGISAHAELTMPIFSINGGVGFNIINPNGDKRFYQQLAIKVFLTKKLFLNFGYGLGNFKNPNNLMLGAGVRL